MIPENMKPSKNKRSNSFRDCFYEKNHGKRPHYNSENEVIHNQKLQMLVPSCDVLATREHAINSFNKISQNQLPDIQFQVMRMVCEKKDGDIIEERSMSFDYIITVELVVFQDATKSLTSEKNLETEETIEVISNTNIIDVPTELEKIKLSIAEAVIQVEVESNHTLNFNQSIETDKSSPTDFTPFVNSLEIVSVTLTAREVADEVVTDQSLNGSSSNDIGQNRQSV